MPKPQFTDAGVLARPPSGPWSIDFHHLFLGLKKVEVAVVMVVVGGGVAEVTAISLAAYFAKNSLFPGVKHTQNAHANKHE